MEDAGTTRARKVKNHLKDSGFYISVFQKKFYNKFSKFEISDNFDQDLYKLASGNHHVRELPQLLLNLSCFKEYATCHLIWQEKGKPVGKNYSYTHHNGFDAKNITIYKFNSLLNYIKKSRNKNFNQSEIFKNELSFVGHFIAREFEIKNYFVILAFSNNSLIAPSTQEYEYLDFIIDYISFIIQRSIIFTRTNSNKKILREALTLTPESILLIKDKFTLYKNKKSSNIKDNPHFSQTHHQVSFNGICDLVFYHSPISVSGSIEYFHQQRVKLLGELLNTLQHELSNPLFGIGLISEILAKETHDSFSRETLHEITKTAHRCQNIIKGLSILANDNITQQPISIYELISEVLLVTKSETKDISKTIIYWDVIHDKEFSSDQKQEFTIITNPFLLTQILFNFIINAADAIHENSNQESEKNIAIRVEKHRKFIQISVSDSGIGLINVELNKMFTPFYTTKKTGNGLGLSICQNFAKKLGSQIEFRNNSPLSGATFSVKLFTEV